MHAVVTGCAGFIGAHLTERLLSDGWRVLGIDAIRPYYAPAEKWAALDPLRQHPNFEFVEADLVTAQLDELISTGAHVFHLAAQPGVRGSFGATFAQYAHDNVMATQRVFEAALARSARRVVWASSSSIYGDASSYPCLEATPPRPRSPYGVTKVTCEHLANVYRELGLDTIGLRYFTVYGPGQRPDMAIRRLCESSVSGSLFQLFGDGQQSRDFTHVVDAVDATVRAALVEAPVSIINVGGGQEATLLEVINAISMQSGRPLDIEPGRSQRGDVRRTGADTTLARRCLGWEPTIGLLDGIRSELDWVRERRAAADRDATVAPAHRLATVEDRP